jgi:V/A-type H+-transporting ATPase subunit A
MLREDFLQQDAFSDIDSYCSPMKQYTMLKTIMTFYKKAILAVEKGADPADIAKVSVKQDVAKMKYTPEEEFLTKGAPAIIEKMSKELDALL